MKLFLILAPIFLVGLLFLQVMPILKPAGKKNLTRKILKTNIFTFFSFLIFFTIVMIFDGINCAAETMSSEILSLNNDILKGVLAGSKYFAAALSTGIGSLAAAKAVATAAPAAIGAYSENQKTFGKAMIFVVLGEGLAIYGFVIAFLILFSK